MRTRSERRHHHQRMLEKVKHFTLYQYFKDPAEIEQHQKRMAENRKPCSCHMCGNPRKHHKDKKTLQEKRMDEYALGDE